MDTTYPYRPGDHVLLLEDVFGGCRPQRRVICSSTRAESSFKINPNVLGTVASWVKRADIVPYTEFAELALSELADDICAEYRAGKRPSDNNVQRRLDELINYLFD